jgi:hypothetical protein
VKLVFEWQASQAVGGEPIGMWLPGMPCAETLLWQSAQLPVTPMCVNIAPAQLTVVWQASHSRSVTM